MPVQPMAEVFGHKIDDFSPEAIRIRKHRLCPFNNRVPSCTKDKANDPLGVCSVYAGESVAITCPVRFRENWQIVSDAAEFFFPPEATWTSFTEIRLSDANGKSAGNIDIVLVSYDAADRIVDFGAVEVQAVYISGNVRNSFDFYMADPQANAQLDWRGRRNYPHADFLSSSRKRLAPQLIYKGSILHSWKRKMAVAIDEAFFTKLPALPEVEREIADVAWLVYDLRSNDSSSRFSLAHSRTVYTKFTAALQRITNPEPGPEGPFLKLLQRKLKEHQTRLSAMTVGEPLLSDLFSGDEEDVDEEDEE